MNNNNTYINSVNNFKKNITKSNININNSYKYPSAPLLLPISISISNNMPKLTL